ncbi:hypothetical protein [Nocardia vaccinii]|uniref:hypothetical protein n=1 Tax=Nocardia vaccinii TaxID=1822 RepID=UPI0012F4DB16|nr:hypothetical protein [Nocardia vaccinii]
MNDITPTASLAAVAVALHEVFDASAHAPDSFELWVAVADAAARHLSVHTAPPQWLAVFTVYRKLRTEARFHPGTGRVEITSGPLAGTTYRDFDGAARAVVTHHPLAQYVSPLLPDLPTWRLNRVHHVPDPRTRLRPAANR